jgi:hypothetical protein
MMNITAAPPVDLPLSTAQRGIWLAHLLDPTGIAHNIAQYTELHGEIDIALFQRAADHVVKSTVALSLRVQIIDDAPRLLVAHNTGGGVELLDLSDDLDPPSAVQGWMRKSVETPFDLSAGHLFRWALIKLARDHFVWLQCYHHLILDGWSLALLERQVADAYTELVLSGQLRMAMLLLGSPTIAEADYRSSRQWQKDRDYWLHALRDWPETPSLSGKHAVMSRRFKRRSIALTDDLVTRLAATARERQVTLPQLLVAAGAIYYASITGKSDIVLSMAGPVRLRTCSHA